MALRIPNLGAKLLAFLLALVVYAHVVTEKEQESQMDIPVRVVDLPEGLVLQGGVPAAARVAVRGKAKLLPFLRVKTPELVVKLADARPGEVQRMLSPADVELPVGVDVDVTEIVEPRRATFSVDTLVTESFPVRVTTRGELPPEVSLVDSLLSVPPRVRITGPSRVLGRLAAVETVPVDLSRLARAPTQDVRVAADPGLRAEPAVVRVDAALVARGTRRFSRLPVRFEDGVTAKALPDTVGLLLEGPQPVLDTLRATSIALRLDTRSLNPGRHFLSPDVVLPHAGLRILEMRPTRLVVEIGDAGS
jgi:YbbR domain-containing protein